MKIVKPEDCALVITIPLRKDDFLSELFRQEKDFVQKIRLKYKNLNEDFLWEEIYLPTVKTVTAVSNVVKSQGVSVIHDASFRDFSNLFKKFRVITLVAHWRSSEFHPGDFKNPLSLLDRLQNPENQIESKIAKLFFESWSFPIKSLEGLDDYYLSDLLANTLNNLLCENRLCDFFVPNDDTKIHYDFSQLKYLNRAAINSCFSGQITPGNRIEFFDKSYSVEDVASVIPEEYDGVLDFTVCHSTIIGNEIKKNRQCVVIVNKEQTSVIFRMILYRGIVKLLKRTDTNYKNASTDIRMRLFKNSG